MKDVKNPKLNKDKKEEEIIVTQNRFSIRKFILPLIAFILMAGVLIYLLIELKKPENEYIKESQRFEQAHEEAETVVILSDLKKELDAPFITVVKNTFEWNTNDGKETINGWSIEVNKVDNELTQRVGDYLKSYGFIPDINNISGGVVGSATGYTMKNMICLEQKMLSEYEEGIDIQSINKNLWDIKVYCGYIND